jgi:hypothetical protein
MSDPVNNARIKYYDCWLVVMPPGSRLGYDPAEMMMISESRDLLAIRLHDCNHLTIKFTASTGIILGSKKRSSQGEGLGRYLTKAPSQAAGLVSFAVVRTSVRAGRDTTDAVAKKVAND